MQQIVRGAWGKIALGLAAVVFIAIVAGGFYIFGGPHSSASPSGSSGGSAAQLTPTTNETVYTINPSGSEASFTIDEVLFGNPNTVVGKTSQVSGEILINKQDPSKTRIGQIKVNLSTLVTDNDLRNNTIQNRILETGDSSNQFATFDAKSIDGLPSSIAVGQTVSFKMTGDLTIHGVTKSTTFDVTATLQSANVLKGEAQTTIKYADFNIHIPDVPSVTGVGDSVKLDLTFMANAQ
jgi:polyisoprenoid-binding protein YceI